jgi:hypothetical protein
VTERIGDHPVPSLGQRVGRGRPKGSVGLTDELFSTIVGLIRSGTFDHVAAEAAGISERTFREWIARGEGRHPTRPQTPKLRAFADAVRKARAEARAIAETSVYRSKPESWLRYVARSTPGREGWTDPGKVQGQAAGPGDVRLPQDATDEQIAEEIRRLDLVWRPPAGPEPGAGPQRGDSDG